MTTPITLSPADIVEAKTILLFEMFLVKGVTPPVHSETGLPKIDSCNGYAAVWDTFRERGIVAPPTAIYLNRLAEETGTGLDELELVFLTGYREPTSKAETLMAQTGARLHLSAMKELGLTPSLPLNPKTKLPDNIKACMAYAALQTFRRQRREAAKSAL